MAAYERGGEAELPRWEFGHDGWVVKFYPIPKSAEARGKPGVRPLGLVANGFRWVQTAAHMRDSLVDKAGRYGELDLPYVVAINVLDHIDGYDTEEALFGAECVTVKVSPDGVEATPDRTPDGVWTSRAGPRYARLSAVLVTSELHISSCGSGGVTLWHNP